MSAFPTRLVRLTEETTETLCLSCDILQPGPAALTDGVRQLQALIRRCAEDNR